MEKPVKILILGNGFGGIYTLKHLHKLIHEEKSAELTLVGEKNYFLFTPLLHEVATGGLNPESTIEPVRELLGCCRNTFHLGKARLIGTKDRTVQTEESIIPYDYLVVATGAETNFYDIPGAQEHALPLKSAEDAIRIKNRILRAMEQASATEDRIERKKLLAFTIVGGGPTGVELTAEIEELINDTFPHYYPEEILEDVTVVLVHRDTELVRQFGPKMRAKSLEVLRAKGVSIRLSSAVKEVGSDFVIFDDGSRIDSRTTIWVAGIKPRIPEFDVSVERTPDGRIIVDEFFRLPGLENVFAIGDAAAFKSGEKFLPALAQVAEKEARVLARNIWRIIHGKQPEMFRYAHSGNLLSIGQWMAAGEIKGFAFSGRFAWWMWRTVYLFKFISARKKLRVAIDWTVNLFTPRDISEL